MDFQGVEYILSQGVDGKWYGYFADYSSSNNLDDTTGTGLEYGTSCAGLGTNGTTAGTGGGTSYDIVASNVTVWAEAYVDGTHNSGTGQAGDCNNIDGADGTNDATAATATSGASERPLLTDAVLTGAPALSDHDDNATDLGQRLHILNSTSGHGSWPFIFACLLYTSPSPRD